MTTHHCRYAYRPGTFTNLSRTPATAPTEMLTYEKHPVSKRLGLLIQSIGRQFMGKIHELDARASEVYGPDDHSQIEQPLEPVIHEYDTSHRSDVYRKKSSYWLRGERDLPGPPLYQRVYVFPVPVLDEKLGVYELMSNYPDVLAYDHPVRKLGRYATSHLKGQVWEMNLYAGLLETKLTPAADAAWQHQPPDAFHRQLSSLLYAVHPDFPYSSVESAEGKPEGFNGRIFG